MRSPLRASLVSRKLCHSWLLAVTPPPNCHSTTEDSQRGIFGVSKQCPEDTHEMASVEVSDVGVDVAALQPNSRCAEVVLVDDDPSIEVGHPFDFIAGF